MGEHGVLPAGAEGGAPTIYPTMFDPIRRLYSAEYDKVRAGTQTAAQGMTAIKGQINELLKQGTTPK